MSDRRFTEHEIERGKTEARMKVYNINRRADDTRIDDMQSDISKLKEFAEVQRVMFDGEGEKLGLKAMIHSIYEDLHGTEDRDGALKRLNILESKEAARNRNLGVAIGTGIGLGSSPVWIGKLYKLITGG